MHLASSYRSDHFVFVHRIVVFYAMGSYAISSKFAAGSAAAFVIPLLRRRSNSGSRSIAKEQDTFVSSSFLNANSQITKGLPNHVPFSSSDDFASMHVREAEISLKSYSEEPERYQAIAISSLM